MSISFSLRYIDALIDQLKASNYAYIEDDPYLHGFGKKNNDGMSFSNGICVSWYGFKVKTTNCSDVSTI